MQGITYLLLFYGSQCPVQAISDIHFVVAHEAIQTAAPVTAAAVPVESENEVVLWCEEIQPEGALRSTTPSTATRGIYINEY